MELKTNKKNPSVATLETMNDCWATDQPRYSTLDSFKSLNMGVYGHCQCVGGRISTHAKARTFKDIKETGIEDEIDLPNNLISFLPNIAVNDLK